MSSINSQTNPFPQSNNNIQGSGLTYFVNKVCFEIIRNLKRFHILIANYADEVSIQHFFTSSTLFQNLLHHEICDTSSDLRRSMLGNTLI